MNNKRAMLLQTTIVLILVALLIAGSASAAHKFFKSKDNSDKLDHIADTISTVLNYQSYSTGSKKISQTTYIPLKTNELFMFFSSGDKDIFLKQPKKPHVKDSFPIQMEFKRPDVSECKNNACICYCKLPSAPWQRTVEKPYLESKILFFHNISVSKPFKCINPLCKSIKSIKGDNIFFGNSRGSEEFKNSFLKSAEKQSYDISIPMDVPILLANPIDDKFNRDIFTMSFLTMFSHWENGVVIGGMGRPRSDSDKDNHILKPVSIVLKIETYPQADNIVGVCLDDVDNCLYEKRLTELTKKLKNIKNEETTENDLLSEKIKLNIYLKNNLTKELEDLFATTQFDKLDETKKDKILKHLFERLDNFFTQTKNDFSKPELRFMSKTDETSIALYQLNGLVDESNNIKIHSPIDEEGKSISVAFTGVDKTANELILLDGSRKQLDITLLKSNGKTELSFLIKETNFVMSRG